MPVSLKQLNLYQAGKFTGGIPAEWSSMTNLAELNMAYCGLDGECLVYVQFNAKTHDLPRRRRTGVYWQLDQFAGARARAQRAARSVYVDSSTK